jgi:hypothetical protein
MPDVLFSTFRVIAFDLLSGHGDVWKGYADILVKRSVDKVENRAYKEVDSGEPRHN